MDENHEPGEEERRLIPALGGGKGPAISVVALVLLGYLVYQAYLFFFG